MGVSKLASAHGSGREECPGPAGRAGWLGVLAVVVLGGAPDASAQVPDLVIPAPVQDRYPRWDPDGETVWFHSNRLGQNDLYRVVDGTVERVTTEPLDEVLPVPSPDGTQVLFTLIESGAEDLWLLDLASGRRTRLTDDPAQDTDGSWAPDGRSVIFTSNRGGAYDIWRVPVDGGDAMRLTDDSRRDGLPSLSPDGRYLAFQRTVERTNADVFVRDLETGEERNVTEAPRWDGWPSWSPDGEWLLFATNRSGASELAQVRPDGSGRHVVARIPGAQVRRAHWSPDGTRIVTNVDIPGQPLSNVMILGGSLLLPVPDSIRHRSEAGPGTGRSSGVDLDALRSVADGIVRSGRAVGLEVRLRRGDDVLLHEGWGWRDREQARPMVPGTIHSIRSMTKPMAGTVIQILLDRDLLELSDRVALHLPSFRNSASREVTVDELLLHRAGYEQGPPGRPWRTFRSVRELADAWGERGPSLPRDGRWVYADAHADILGAVAEEVTGTEAGELLEQAVLDPLGLDDTLVLLRPDDSRLDRVATLYAGRTGSWTRVWGPDDIDTAGPHFPFTMYSQSLYASLADYDRFMRMWLGGGCIEGWRLLSEDAVRRAFTAHPGPVELPGTIPPEAVPPLLRERPGAYGHLWGLALGDDSGAPFAFFHQGSDGTAAYAFPELDLVALFAMQSRGTDALVDLEAALLRHVVGPLSAGAPM